MGHEKEIAEKNLILKFLAGSHVYGTNVETSDKDYIGVFIPSEDYILGTKTCEQVELRTNPSSSGKQNSKEDIDTVLYSLPKFIKLLEGNNPTLLETLFYPEKNILFANDYGRELMAAAPLFVSKQVKARFLGYAFSQKKGLTHKKERWVVINEAFKKLEEFEAQGHKTLPEKLYLHSELREDKTWGSYEKGQPIEVVKNLLEKMLNSYGYRIEDIKEFGFSRKFASHLIRLLEEGIELLVEGRLTFPLAYNNLLRDIKLGKMSLDEILKIADRKEAQVEEAYIHSPLPNKPNCEEINKLQIKLLKDFWGYK